MQPTTKPETPNLKTPRGDAEMLLRFGSAVGVPRSPVTSDLEAFIEPENGIPYLVAPDGYQVHSLEHLLPNPTRKRAEVGVILHNAGSEPFTINHGDRIAQLKFIEYVRASLDFDSVGDDTRRGGFGSTGIA